MHSNIFINNKIYSQIRYSLFAPYIYVDTLFAWKNNKT